MGIVNFCGITNKVLELETLISSHKLSIVLGTESHLHAGVFDAEVFPSQFNVYRKDRNAFGGGVFILVDKSIPSYHLSTNSSIEDIWVCLHLSTGPPIIVGSFYRPPNSAVSVLDDLSASLSYIKSHYPSSRIILGGDFNCPGIDWSSSCLTESYVSTVMRERLIRLSNDFQIQQLITFATRGANVLDLCFTTHPDLIRNCTPLPGLSDHETVLVELSSMITHSKQVPRRIYLYNKANWDTIRECVVNLSEGYFSFNQNPNTSVEENWKFIHNGISEIVDEHVPCKTLGTRTHLPWMSASLKRLIQRKQRIYNRARRFQRNLDWQEYRTIRSQVKNLTRHQHKTYLSNILSNSNNRKPFWRYLKSRKQDNIGIGTLKTQDGKTVTDPYNKAEVLNRHFQSVFTTEDSDHVPDKGPSPYTTIADIEITTQGVYNLLQNLDTHKSPGPDGIHGHFLKATATEIAPVLTHLFQHSLSEGTLPSTWKQAYVSPIFKKGNKTDPGNYRPVSLTSIVCKTMEHVICSQMMRHLESNNILAENQFGFRSNHSCESQLLITIDDFAKALDNKLQVDVGILDFSKAFDKVSHPRLLHKLNYYGIQGNMSNWLKAFLSDRTQQVMVNGSLSSQCNVTSGVPQGSVLGPVLFLVYINDIVADIRSQIRLFADDCLIYRTIRSHEDHMILQEDLNNLSKWADSWKMMFNVSKCSIMQISMAHHKSTFAYTMYGDPLSIATEHRYLGILINDKLSWRPHIDQLCHKANQLLGFLQRNLRGCSRSLKEHSYKQMILPIIEYCSAIWDPHHQNAIHKLEMIQHRAARFVLNKPWRRNDEDSVSQMLTVLNWPSLQDRRKYSRLLLLYKIVNNQFQIPMNYLPYQVNCNTRAQHPSKYRHYQVSTEVYRYSFFPRTIPDWNNLPINNINELNLDQFKDTLSNLLL